MKRMATFVTLAALALTACEDQASAPISPAAPAAPVPAASAIPALSAGESACPCWSERSLASAFPVASFHFEDLTAEAEAGRAVLQLGDVANARVLQALVQYAPRPAGGAGDNWCQVATFGTAGLEREATSAIRISAEEFAACAGMVRDRAAALGVATSAD
ncbi:MAG TPA: hypothetical protein VM778_14445 [Gemmatimonadota bacterium]|nr:hypothetical protein [Gemmatimonadota bacterium]